MGQSSDKQQQNSHWIETMMISYEQLIIFAILQSSGGEMKKWKLSGWRSFFQEICFWCKAFYHNNLEMKNNIDCVTSLLITKKWAILIFISYFSSRFTYMYFWNACIIWNIILSCAVSIKILVELSSAACHLPLRHICDYTGELDFIFISRKLSCWRHSHSAHLYKVTERLFYRHIALPIADKFFHVW